MKHLKEFDILNNKICPFCNKMFVLDKGTGPDLGFYNCLNHHMRLWYTENYWNGARVYINGIRNSICILAHDSRISIWREKVDGIIYIPQFNIFDYSIEELYKKN